MYRINRRWLSLLLAMQVIPMAATAASVSEPSLQVVSQDWVMDGVFTQGVEGPAVSRDGTLYAVNFANEGTIGQVDSDGKASLFVTLPKGSTGNGIRFDQDDNMYIADYQGHNILRLTAGSRDTEVFAHNAKMNQPNDIAIMDNGILFASDPNWSNDTGQLWRIDTNGETQLLAKDMGTTNGVEVSPDNRRLYVNESVQQKVWVFDVNTKGEISNKRLLIEFAEHGLDGMRCDSEGNLYIARYGAGVIAKVSPQGKLLQEFILKGDYPTNVAFGGEAGNTLFVTMQKRGAIERLSLDSVGRATTLWRKK